jgi:cytochrome b6-f complex iron-sulfur subunit
MIQHRPVHELHGRASQDSLSSWSARLSSSARCERGDPSGGRQPSVKRYQPNSLSGRSAKAFPLRSLNPAAFGGRQPTGRSAKASAERQTGTGMEIRSWCLGVWRAHRCAAVGVCARSCAPCPRKRHAPDNGHLDLWALPPAKRALVKDAALAALRLAVTDASGAVNGRKRLRASCVVRLHDVFNREDTGPELGHLAASDRKCVRQISRETRRDSREPEAARVLPRARPMRLPKYSRREFCVHSLHTASLAAVAIAVTGCGGSGPMSASGGAGTLPALPAINSNIVSSTISLTIDASSPLASVGNAALITASGRSFLVARTAQNTFTALTAVCTHEACTVSNYQNQVYECPCHGSEYTTSGTVVRGPAQRSLTTFATTFANNVLIISV